MATLVGSSHHHEITISVIVGIYPEDAMITASNLFV